MLKKIVYSTLVFLLLRTTVSAVLGHRDFPFLLTKLIGPTAPEQGTRMPLAVGAFHNGKIDAVRAWIAAGAPQTGKIKGVGDLGVLRDPEETFEPPAPPPMGQGYQTHLLPYKIEPGTEREVFYATYITDENGDPIEDDIFINGYEIFVSNLEIYVPPGLTRVTKMD